MKSNRSRFLFGIKQGVTLLTMLGLLCALYFCVPNIREALQYVFFIPIVFGSLFLGWKKASAFTVVGVCLILCISLPNAHELSGRDIITNIIWGSSLGVTSAVVGLTIAIQDNSVERELKRQSELALTDQLTDMANRRAFDFELERRMAEFERYSWQFSLLMVDIDYFKKFNDSFGHAIGDQVLRDIAQIVKSCVRDVDMVARHGGEEFAVLLPDTSVDDAKAIAERIRAEVNYFSPPYLPNSRHLSVSIGVTIVGGTDNIESILQRADFAMYTAKENGRNSVFLNTGRDAWTKEDGGNRREEERPQPNQRYFTDAQSLLEGTSDHVTSLSYQKIFKEELVRRIFEVNRYKYDLSVATIRLPGFHEYCQQNSLKPTNVLAKFGPLLRQSLRNSDLITWQRQNEFLVCLPFSSYDESLVALERINWEISYLDHSTSAEIPKEIRVIHHRPGETAEELLQRLNSVDPIEFDTTSNLLANDSVPTSEVLA